MTEQALTIGALAREAGVGVETVRYYQRRALLPAPPRPASGARRYGTEDLRRLRFVRAGQRAGFTLDEIAELLELDATRDRTRARTLARDRLAALDTRIAELDRARDWLRRLEAECTAGGTGPCPILTAFEG